MKIQMGSFSDSLKVFDDDGNDITSSLCIASISIHLTPGEMIEVQMTCYAEMIKTDSIPKNQIVMKKEPIYGTAYTTGTTMNPCGEIPLSADITSSPWKSAKLSASQLADAYITDGSIFPSSQKPKKVKMKPEAILDQFKVK